MSEIARKRIKAKAWMVGNGIRIRDIQRAIGSRSHSQISSTLLGKRSHKKTLAWLKEQGCPEEYLT
jgi:hypothetical protein